MPKTTDQIRRVTLVLTLMLGLGFAPAAAADSLTLRWDANSEPEVTGYTVFIGVQPGDYVSSVDVGNVLSFVLQGPPPGERYYFAVGAYGVDLVSPLSSEVSGTSNDFPVLHNPGNQTSTAGQAISVSLFGSDPRGDRVTYSATGLPAGVTLSKDLGWITGTVTTAGTYNVTATVSDGVLSDSESFAWTVLTANGAATGATARSSNGTSSGATAVARPSSGSGSSKPAPNADVTASTPSTPDTTAPATALVNVGAAAVTGQTATTVSASAPSVQTPVDQASFAEGGVVVFSALAHNADNGDVSHDIVWSSNVDGRIGTGGTILKALTAGTHTIIAAVTDSRGTTRTTQIVIVVGG